ncbi:PP2C family protein-serine/threonine phosphatase [Streptomyces sp. NPDC007088]|uniref:PP2C family protein-serine/threonine phosphatase n=1 Tax=Streptomyces sp. NPDC007088 TaxID=3364773 RepID=UPI0036738162
MTPWKQARGTVWSPVRAGLLRVRGRRVGWLVPLVLLVVVPTADILTGVDFRVISWLVVVPGTAAALCGVRTTVLFSVLTVAVYFALNRVLDADYRTGWPDFALVVAGSALSVAACAFRLRDARYVSHMQAVAETTRSTVLRPLPAHWAGMDHAAVYLAADSEARVGGDFYDIQPSPYGTRVIVGDVQGKGLNAVTAASAILGSFREWGFHERDLTVAARHLETRMRRYQEYGRAMGQDQGDRFATAALVGFPPPGHEPTDTVELVDFGHEPPLAVGPRGVRELTTVPALPLGLGALLDEPPVMVRIELAQDETLLLVTDGVTEARDRSGAFFPLRERLAEAMARDPLLAAPGLLVRLVRDQTLRHTHGRLTDDTTVLAVRRALVPEPGDPPVYPGNATVEEDLGGRPPGPEERTGGEERAGEERRTDGEEWPGPSGAGPRGADLPESGPPESGPPEPGPPEPGPPEPGPPESGRSVRDAPKRDP